MNKPVIVSAVRTAIAKKGGSLSSQQPYEYSGSVIREALNRVNIENKDVADVIFGNTLSSYGNIARVSALHAGLEETTPGLTIDRQCGSGINAVFLAAQFVQTSGKIAVAGGTESMTHTPYLLAPSAKPFDTRPPEFLPRALTPPEWNDTPMGLTAENLAEKYHISKEEQDKFAYESQQKMKKAMEEERFKEQILPIAVTDRKGNVNHFQIDEHPRPDINIEQLNNLKAVFKKEGSVTAGSSSGLNDAAAALVVMSEKEAENRNLDVLGEIIHTAVVGVAPDYMGIGPVPAIQKVLEEAEMTLEEIDLVEINEAFAAQVLACQRELKIAPEMLNVSGGAIAHGHPIAATGAILITKVLYELKRQNLSTAIVSACIGGGQGIAMILKRPEGEKHE
ncbi:thiolase family protein [Alkalicoccus daliensis]|uniref:acetyl-CoA C-acetyltransferase n=1 Tax=Alkalicoccus daliensis TaxID=745820 RepID=A0A1H0J0U4_9BACI|nr:thiolase family protein [Alkalicoccus daliensis]SDO37173.1 acetyl-CoA C-acetyltransferase [Alkalicoccus daliensis]